MEPLEPTIAFDEKFYLENNADIAQAVREGRLKSGLEHYLWRGHIEGRQPNATASYHLRLNSEASLDELAEYHSGRFFTAPRDLAVTSLLPKKVLIVGSCFANSWKFHNASVSGCGGDFVLTNNLASLPEQPPSPIASYDFQIVQIALRSIIHDRMLWALKEGDLQAHQAAFESARSRLSLQLRQLLRWNTEGGLLTFVTNFVVPQSSPSGRLMPRYDLCNPVHFIEQLNVALGDMIKGSKNIYLVDADAVSASIGRRHVQDDIFTLISHNALLPFACEETGRIEPSASLGAHYERNGAQQVVRSQSDFIGTLWAEIVAAYRTICQTDMVKLVVIDLDDTLWKGVSGDQESIGPDMIEGWPLGFIEALAFLKRRGILLAIASKNDDERIRLIWDSILGRQLSLSDFATVKINWRPKADNVAEILSELNLLPRNVVFVDDNPVERSAMKARFPDMRVLGRHPYYLRRILLWSPETQVARVSEESSRRTEMIQAQIQRDTARKELTREEFLMSLALRCRMFAIDNTSDSRFPRCFELINKTNQFNTTGRRWKADECERAFSEGMVFHAFEVQDRFVDYGLVGVVITRKRTIEQFVMSCRVVGLDVEVTVLRSLMQRMLSWSSEPIRAEFVRTDANVLCRDIFHRCGFAEHDGIWTWEGAAVPELPEHVELA